MLRDSEIDAESNLFEWPEIKQEDKKKTRRLWVQRENYFKANGNTHVHQSHDHMVSAEPREGPVYGVAQHNMRGQNRQVQQEASNRWYGFIGQPFYSC